MAPLPRNDILLVSVNERSRLLEPQHALYYDEETATSLEKEEETNGPLHERDVNIGNNNALRRAGDSERSLLSRGWIAYTDKLERWPLLVKSITAFFLLGLADVCAQGCQHQSWTTSAPMAPKMSWNWMRSLRFGIFGLLGAPWSHYYFDLLDRFLPPTPDRPCSYVTFLKLFIDQFLQAPLLLALITAILHAMEGLSLANIWHDLQEHYWTTLVTNCTYSTLHTVYCANPLWSICPSCS